MVGRLYLLVEFATKEGGFYAELKKVKPKQEAD
jgi:hypothetical protein